MYGLKAARAGGIELATHLCEDGFPLFQNKSKVPRPQPSKKDQAIRPLSQHIHPQTVHMLSRLPTQGLPREGQLQIKQRTGIEHGQGILRGLRRQ